MFFMTCRGRAAYITLSIFNFRGQIVVEQCAYTLPMRYHITHAHYGSTKGVLNTQRSFVPPAALFNTHPAQKHHRNPVCMNIIGIFWPANLGVSLTWRTQKKRDYLPPHCLVGELAHPIELLLHFVFSLF